MVEHFFGIKWNKNWNKNEKFTDIFKKYVNKCLIEKFDVVVFDAYTSLTKDGTRKSRSDKMSQTVEVDNRSMRLPIKVTY